MAVIPRRAEPGAGALSVRGALRASSRPEEGDTKGAKGLKDTKTKAADNFVSLAIFVVFVTPLF